MSSVLLYFIKLEVYYSSNIITLLISLSSPERTGGGLNIEVKDTFTGGRQYGALEVCRCNSILQLQGHYLPTEVWHNDGKPSVIGDSQSVDGMPGTKMYRHSSSNVSALTMEELCG